MRMTPANNNQQQNFGMLQFKVPKTGAKHAEQISYFFDEFLPARKKRISLKVINERSQEMTITAEDKVEALLLLALKKLGIESQIIDNTTKQPIAPEVYKKLVSEPIQKAMGQINKVLQTLIDNIAKD
jgi:Holliday junction resolvasome RuvABC DNA-binding subunit